MKTLIIIAICYLIAHNLKYLKKIQREQKINFLFLTIFLIMLFIPMSNINKNDISKEEGKKLSKWQPLILKNNKINFEFGKNFDQWFNDRFYLKQQFVHQHSAISMFLANRCKNGFVDDETQIIYPTSAFGYTSIKTIKKYFKYLYDFNDYCTSKNIKLYTLIVPNKAAIHKSKYNHKNDDYKHEDFLNYINEIQKEDKIKVIYPYESMIKAVNNGDILFFKTEHHWTDDGAFIGYKELMKTIQKDFPDIKTLNENDYNYFYNTMVRGEFNRKFNYGNECRERGLSNSLCKKYHQYNYRYFKHKDFDHLESSIFDEKFRFGKLYHYDKGANYRVIQLGTSQNENLAEFTAFTFKDIKRIRNNGVKNIDDEDNFKIIKYYENEILDYKPDIIIFCITYRNLKNLNNLFKME